MGRKGIGAELKESYYRQAVRNLAAVDSDALDATRQTAMDLGAVASESMDDEEPAAEVPAEKPKRSKPPKRTIDVHEVAKAGSVDPALALELSPELPRTKPVTDARQGDLL